MKSVRREQTGWYFYDWANSAFSTTVVTLFLGPYLTAMAKAAADSRGLIYPLGIPVDPRSYWGYLVALSVLLQVIVLPAAGAMADLSPRKKSWLAAFAYLGAAATMGMFWIQADAYLVGGLLFLFANVAFGCSVVVYNSFLPQIAEPAERDAVSSKGWGIGYLGGGLLLALNLLLYRNAEVFGISEALAVRISLFSAGAWWALFTLIPVATLRDRQPVLSHRNQSSSFHQFAHTLSGLRNYPQTLLFLLAYFFYNDAIQAVIALASQFGNDELKIPISSLTLTILMVQFVAFLGALVFKWLAEQIGAKRAVMLSLLIWTAVILAIYGIVRNATGFFVVSAVVGLVLGGSQALSRSLFSHLIPRGREAEYFSLYEITDKGTSWLCPLIFALALQFTQSYRLAILSLIVFFVAGLSVLAFVNLERGAKAAQAAA